MHLPEDPAGTASCDPLVMWWRNSKHTSLLIFGKITPINGAECLNTLTARYPSWHIHTHTLTAAGILLPGRATHWRLIQLRSASVLPFCIKRQKWRTVSILSRVDGLKYECAQEKNLAKDGTRSLRWAESAHRQVNRSRERRELIMVIYIERMWR